MGALEEAVSDLFTDLTEETLPKLVRDSVADAVSDIPAKRIEIDIFENERVELQQQHYLFEGLLRMLSARDRQGSPLNVALVGPSGVSKTTMAIHAAKALDKEVVIQPFNFQLPESRVFGYMNAEGEFVETGFFKAFTQGRLYVADEFDAANPGVAISLNTAIANRIVTFPNGETYEAHPDFHAVFTMNTKGTGGNDRYTARQRLDRATLDRLVFFHVPLDPALEASAIGLSDSVASEFELDRGGLFDDAQQVLDYVREVRAAVEELELPHEISPRTTINATALADAGFGKTWIDECVIFRGMSEADISNILDYVED